MRHLALAAILGLSVFPVTAYAHGTGLVFEAVIGEYVMDIDFDVDQAVAGEEIFMEFGLVTPPNTPDWDFASYTDVQVTLARNGKAVFDKALPTSDFRGRRFLNYTFPKRGEYRMTVGFSGSGRLLAEETFAVSVQRDPNSFDPGLTVTVLAGFVLAVGTVFFLSKQYRKPTP